MMTLMMALQDIFSWQSNCLTMNTSNCTHNKMQQRITELGDVFQKSIEQVIPVLITVSFDNDNLANLCMQVVKTKTKKLLRHR